MLEANLNEAETELTVRIPFSKVGQLSKRGKVKLVVCSNGFQPTTVTVDNEVLMVNIVGYLQKRCLIPARWSK